MQQQPLDRISSRLGSFYENNLGCLHLMLGKPNLAVFFFNRALQQQNKHLAEIKNLKSTPKDAALLVKQTEIVYNLGLAMLHAGQPEQAFQSFLSCLPGTTSSSKLHQNYPLVRTIKILFPICSLVPALTGGSVPLLKATYQSTFQLFLPSIVH